MYLFFKKNVEKMFSDECFWFEEGTFCFNFNDKQKMILKKLPAQSVVGPTGLYYRSPPGSEIHF